MSNKADISQYSDSELSMIVMNEEYLYSIRHSLPTLVEVLDEYYIYTDEQLSDLQDTIEEQLS